VMVERTADVALGAAYRTSCERHLLNVRAGEMSAYPHDPGHFVRWLRRDDDGIDEGSFVPRRLYGRYLRTILEEAQTPSGTVHVVRGHVVGVVPRVGRRLTLRCAAGSSFDADAVILAVGHFPPRRLPVASPAVEMSGRYIGDPWAGGALSAIPSGATVVLVGSGLTAVDAALTLSSNGHRGPILALSRHGLLPQAHRLSPTPAPERPPDGGSECALPAPAVLSGRVTSARDLLVAIRRQAAGAGAEPGGDWRSVIDGLRPESNQIWAALPLAEQQRVLRHLRSFWSIHRHRMAPQAAQWIAELQASGQLRVDAGRVVRCSVRPDGLRVEVRGRGSDAATAGDIGYLVNCTGPETDVTRLGDPLLTALLTRGLARLGALGMGLAVGTDGAVLDRAGQASGRLWAIGSLRQGTEWETTAVPELRRQAASVAAQLRAHVQTADLGPYQEAV